MRGTLINIVAILVGGGLGMLFGAQVPERMRKTIVAAIGLFTLGLGVKLFLETQNALIPLAGLLLGALLGEWWGVERGLKNLGSRLEARFSPGSSGQEDDREGRRFVRGFLTASLLFCVGPMTILGSIQDGLTGDYSLLTIKSVMDGFAGLALASTLGVGVLFSVLVVFTYQGGISLLAIQAQRVLTDPMITEMTAVGGILLLGLAIGSLLELRTVRTGNLLPALALTPAIVWVLQWLGLHLVPVP
ncbi:MAG: DUF554 domain-containing protein [Anaerolineae bacterium]|jgi:uncharacterized membrane protein YqgA involved in biofilm formation